MNGIKLANQCSPCSILSTVKLPSFIRLRKSNGFFAMCSPTFSCFVKVCFLWVIFWLCAYDSSSSFECASSICDSE